MHKRFVQYFVLDFVLLRQIVNKYLHASISYVICLCRIRMPSTCLNLSVRVKLFNFSCRLLITFANSLDTDQGFDLDSNCLTL